MKNNHFLKEEYGFTLVETLLTVVIMSLVAAITAAGIPVAKSVYEKTVEASNAELLLSTAVTELRDELGTAWDVEIIGGGKAIKYRSSKTQALTTIEMGTVEGVTSICKQDFVQESVLSESFDGHSSAATAPPHLLVSKAASSKDLYLEYTDITHDSGKKYIQINGLCVRDKNEKIKAKYGTEPSSQLIISVASNSFKPGSTS